MTTNDLSKMLGVTNRRLRTWASRGSLRLAPVNDPGAGYGNDSIWTPAAIDEAVAYKKRLDRKRLVKAFMMRRANGKKESPDSS